jgi:hypothetical protein
MRTAYALLERLPLAEGTDALARHHQPTTLTAVLGGLALQPFSAASVERYRQETVKEANAWLWLHRALRGLPYLSFACAVVGGLGLFCAVGLPAQPPAMQRGYLLTGFAALALGALTLIISGVLEVKDRAVWETVNQPEYQGRIPAAVLLTLCEIQANLPQADFVVHRLVQNRTSLDPFLEARYGDESYFIAVWDEPYTA